MRFYARPSWRLARQVAADAFAVAWVIVCWNLGRIVDATIRGLAGPARQTAQVTGDLQRQVTDAASQASNVPVVGGGLRQPFDGIAGNLDGIIAAANSQVAWLEQTASLVGMVVFAVPTVLLLAVWVPLRLRFALRARHTLALVAAPGGDELLALRALARRPLPSLTTVIADPVGAWRRGDPEAIRALADLELANAGVSRPGSGTATRVPKLHP